MGLYSGLENKWYAFWEKTPLIKLIDGIDKIIPSFALFIIIVIALIAFIGIGLFSEEQKYIAVFNITDNSGEKVSDSVINITLVNKEGEDVLTKRTNNEGELVLEDLSKGDEIYLNINLSKGTYEGIFTINNNLEENISLEKKPAKLEPKKRGISFVNEYGSVISDPLEVEFFCDNPSINVNPKKTTITNGVISITEPVDCIKLNARVKSDKYKTQNIILNSLSKQISLEEYEPNTYDLEIKIREDGFPAEGSFNINLIGKNKYTKLNSSSDATMNVLPGNYTLSISSSGNDYGIVTKTINISNNKTKIVEVSKTIKATLKVIVKDQSNNQKIENAKVALKDLGGRELNWKNSNENGEVEFVFTELGEYKISAKKEGDIDGGYFPNEITLDIDGNKTQEIKLEKITTANAGKVTVKIVDQDNEPIHNARVILKHSNNDSIVELNQQRNYAFSDVNGEATFLAGKVSGRVYASAYRMPFEGSSEEKEIELLGENYFEIRMDVGYAPIKINVEDNTGEKLNAEARSYLMDDTEINGLISVERGSAEREIKAGREVYLAIRSEGKETYYSEPRFLMPEQEEIYNIVMKEEILEPSVEMEGIYTNSGEKIYGGGVENGRTFTRGEKYYALMEMNSDQDYGEVEMHFRAGLEKRMENDYIEIDNIEGEGINREVRGKTFVGEEEEDGENLTESLAKWVTLQWSDFGEGTKIIKINFRIKENANPETKMQFFWNARFGNERRPKGIGESGTLGGLYSNTYSSDPFYESAEDKCKGDFCILDEWFYDEEEELYMEEPFIAKNSNEYTYHLKIINFSGTNYGENAKKMALSFEMMGENGARILEYEVKDSKNQVSGGSVKRISDWEIGNFDNRSTIEITMKIEGYKEGTSNLRVRLKSEGYYVFENERAFKTPNEKEFSISTNKTFIPSMLNDTIEIKIEEEEPLNEVDIIIYAKEPGYEEYVVDQGITNRNGIVILESGAHLPNTKVIIDASKRGYTRKRVILGVREDVVAINPSNITMQLNTITKREGEKEVLLVNQSGKDLVISTIEINAEMEGVINEGALRAYVETLEGMEIEREGNEEIRLIKARIANGITESTLLEPVRIEGEITINFRVKNTGIIFSSILPLKINVGSGAQTGKGCIKVIPIEKNKTTERGRVTFSFELVNRCEANNKGIALEGLTAKIEGENVGLAELALQSTGSTTGGRTIVDGLNREVYGKFKFGEKLFGTVTFIPKEEMIGRTIDLPIEIQGKFLGQTVSTVPRTLDLTVNVLNLRECLIVEGKSAPVGFDDKAEITIDATNCLGQDVEVSLCRNDAGCGGGASKGKISLSKKIFNIKNNSKTINAYSPTLPGSYGVSVWARIRGKGSYNYITEIPVAFREKDSKFFKLSKYEINVIGEGQQDSIMLTNEMLTQSVNVKANNCVWGVESPDTDWMQVIGGAVMGAGLGNMIGSAFEFATQSKTNKAELSTREQREMASDIDTEIKKDGFNRKHVYRDQLGDLTLSDTEINQKGMTFVGTVSKEANSGVDYYSWKGVGKDVKATTTTTGISEHIVSEVSNSSGLGRGVWSMFHKPKASENVVTTKTMEKRNQHSTGGINWLKSETTIWDITDPSNPIPYDSETLPATEATPNITTVTPKEKVPMASFSDKVEKISFINMGRGTFTVIGAILGGVAAYMSQQEDCEDSSQIVGYEDFAIFLQGDKLGITTPEGGVVEKEIEGDALPFNFTLNDIGVDWDFDNADYSSEETVGIRFTNNGLNEAEAKYGTLTVNAKTHKHGSAVLSNERTYKSNAEYDVICNNANFGRYWIGSENDAGSCSGISKGTHTQKYHIRVVSGEAKDAEPFIDKATTCYNGVLTGATGEEALPKIKLDWRWDQVEKDMCDYRNRNYKYCDATQFMITLVKKLTEVNRFLKQNDVGSITCPEDPVKDNARKEIERINEYTQVVVDGFIGVKNINLSIDNEDNATATVTIENKTGEAKETHLSISWKGNGEPIIGGGNYTIPAGESTHTFEATLPKYDDLYFFNAVVNGPKGNRRTITRALENRPENVDCWIDATTREIGGVPAITYFLGSEDNIIWTNEIQDIYDLYEHLNFGVYLMRDAYSEQFINDFKSHYLNTLFGPREEEKKMLEWISPENLYIMKRFTNQANVQEGLYDVRLNIDFDNSEDLVITNSPKGAIVETSLLLVRNPINPSPFYKIPINGEIGMQGRQNYGAVFKNQNEELEIINGLYTLENVSGNGVIEIKTNKEKNFEKINTRIGSRGQLAIISAIGGSGEMTFTPNIATPIIAKKRIDGTSGKMEYRIDSGYSVVKTGNNMSYWTGAAKSKDFYGGNAVEVYDNSADYLLDGGDSYGFEWKDITHDGTLYLKTIFYTPLEREYILIGENNTKFWSPNAGMGSQAILNGISEMKNNNQSQQHNTLKDLFEMVKNKTVCVSNDGSTSSFWWNPRALETTRGTKNSLLKEETELIGQE